MSYKFYHITHLVYCSQVELVINQDVSVVILVVKTVIICQDMAVFIYMDINTRMSQMFCNICIYASFLNKLQELE